MSDAMWRANQIIESEALLRRLRDEVRDWAEALNGEREGLEALLAEIDQHLGQP